MKDGRLGDDGQRGGIMRDLECEEAGDDEMIEMNSSGMVDETSS